MPTASALFQSVLVALCLLATCAAAGAHEGHDHGAGAPAPTAAEGPRLSAQSDSFEVVAFPQGDDLIIYLDDMDSNEPVRNAAVTVSSAGVQIHAQELASGIYKTRPD